MRIMFLSDLWIPFPGGAERYVFNIARELHKRGHEISVLTSYERAIPGHPDFELIQELGLGRRENKAARAEMLKAHTDSLRPDVIFIHRYFAEEYGEIVQSWGKPVVEVVHQHVKLRGTKVQVYNTEFTRRENGATHDSSSMVIIPPAYEEIRPDHLGKYLGFVKPLPGKGIDFLYELADRLEFREFLILRGEWQPLETIVDKPNIRFLNPVESMKEFYAQCRITLMPSLREDAGTIPQESAICGIPCISSDIMGLNETNIGGLRLPLSISRWTEEILQLDNDSYYSSIQIRQKRALASFDWDEKFDELDRRIRT